MNPALAAIHIAAAAVGTLAAIAGLFVQRQRGRRARMGHVVMTAAMSTCFIRALQMRVPVALVLVLTVIAWLLAWSGAAAERRAEDRSGLPLDLLATSALLLLMPMSMATPSGGGSASPSPHLHVTGTNSTTLFALAITVGWLLAALLRCGRPRERQAQRFPVFLPSLCAAGMAGSMVVMAAVDM